MIFVSEIYNQENDLNLLREYDCNQLGVYVLHGHSSLYKLSLSERIMNYFVELFSCIPTERAVYRKRSMQHYVNLAANDPFVSLNSEHRIELLQKLKKWSSVDVSDIQRRVDDVFSSRVARALESHTHIDFEYRAALESGGILDIISQKKRLRDESLSALNRAAIALASERGISTQIVGTRISEDDLQREVVVIAEPDIPLGEPQEEVVPQPLDAAPVVPRREVEEVLVAAPRDSAVWSWLGRVQDAILESLSDYIPE